MRQAPLEEGGIRNFLAIWPNFAFLLSLIYTTMLLMRSSYNVEALASYVDNDDCEKILDLHCCPDDCGRS